MPKIAIITRTKNREALLPRAIESVLSQKYESWMHVIVNDGGNVAEIEKIIKPYIKNYSGRLKIIHNSVSLGMEAASNIGIKESESEWVVIHDDDDSWDCNFLEIMLNRLEEDSFDGCVCHVKQVFEEEVNGVINTKYIRYYNPELKKITLKDMKLKNMFLPISFVFSRKNYEKLGGFDESFQVCGDWDFHFKYTSQYKVKVLCMPLANYHVRNSESSSKEFKNSIYKKSLHDKYKKRFLEKHKINKTEILYAAIKEYLFYKPLRILLRSLK